MSRPTYICKIFIPKPGGGELCSTTFRLKSQVAENNILDNEFFHKAESGDFGVLGRKMVERYGGYEKLREDWAEAYSKTLDAMNELVHITEEFEGYKKEREE